MSIAWKLALYHGRRAPMLSRVWCCREVRCMHTQWRGGGATDVQQQQQHQRKVEEVASIKQEWTWRVGCLMDVIIPARHTHFSFVVVVAAVAFPLVSLDGQNWAELNWAEGCLSVCLPATFFFPFRLHHRDRMLLAYIIAAPQLCVPVFVTHKTSTKKQQTAHRKWRG